MLGTSRRRRAFNKIFRTVFLYNNAIADFQKNHFGSERKRFQIYSKTTLFSSSNPSFPGH